jgi:hypothetical protein
MSDGAEGHGKYIFATETEEEMIRTPYFGIALC